MDEESAALITNSILTKRKMEASNDDSVDGNIFRKRVRTCVSNEDTETDTNSTPIIKPQGISNLYYFSRVQNAI